MTLPGRDAAAIAAVPPSRPELLDAFERVKEQFVAPEPRYATVELEDGDVGRVERHVTDRLAAAA